MSKALIFALLFAGLPAAAYADEGGGAIGAIVRAPGEAAAGIVGGLTGTEAPRFHHYVVEEHGPVLHLGGASSRRRWRRSASRRRDTSSGSA